MTRMRCWFGRHDRIEMPPAGYGVMWRCRRCTAHGVDWSYYFTERYG